MNRDSRRTANKRVMNSRWKRFDLIFFSSCLCVWYVFFLFSCLYYISFTGFEKLSPKQQKKKCPKILWPTVIYFPSAFFYNHFCFFTWTFLKHANPNKGNSKSNKKATKEKKNGFYHFRKICCECAIFCILLKPQWRYANEKKCESVTKFMNWDWN